MIKLENLYQPDKYKVFLGNGKTVALCTVWNEPEKAIDNSPEILDKFAIIGTLYSRQGVNIILRNLALNPQIRTLYLWDYGTLSCSPFGVSGKTVIEKMWEKGVDEDGKIPEADFKIEKEIDPKIVNKIIKEVKLEKINVDDLEKIIPTIQESPIQSYMDPVRFPDAIIEIAEVFPSEKVGFLVRDKKIINTWIKVLDRIMRYGTIKGTQYGTQQRELIGVNWVVEDEDPENPFLETDWPESLKNTVGLNTNSIEHYKNVFLSPNVTEGVKYTYGNRMQRYPNRDSTVDQIEAIIKELKNSSDTRRAVATTIFPPIDSFSKEPPCITQIQCLQTDGRLHFLVTARSHDIFKAAIPNTFGLLALQKHIAEETGFKIGKLQITSQSAHIYEQDWDDAKKLVRCQIWDRTPVIDFDPEINADQRGMFLIDNQNNKLTAYFKTPSGDDLLSIEGKTAKEICSKIAQLELISRPDHLLDIGCELQKAEIALNKNLKYVQDKPIIF